MQVYPHHTAIKPDRREPMFDILRGSAVVLMITAHAIFFFHTGTNEAVQTVARVGNSVVFTMLLLVSGAVSYLAYFNHIAPQEIKHHIARRALAIYAGYLIVAFVAILTDVNLTTLQARLINMTQASVFVSVPNFSEFLIPFIVFPLTIIPFYRLYGTFMLHLRKWFILAAAVYGMGIGLYLIPVPGVFVPLKALLAGEEGYLRFPLFQYFPVFSLGLWWGATYRHKYAGTAALPVFKKAIFSGLVLVACGFLTVILPASIFNPAVRWPPSVGFLSLGIFAAFTLALVILTFPKPRWLLWVWKVVSYMGKDSFDLYIVHINLLYLYRRFVAVQYEDPFTVTWLILALMTITVIVSSLNWKISPSVFSIGPVTFSNARRYRIKKRYITVVAILLFVAYLQVNVSGTSPIGEFLDKSGLIPKHAHQDVSVNRKWFVKSSLVPTEQLIIRLRDESKRKEAMYTFRIPELNITGSLQETPPDMLEAIFDIMEHPEGEYNLIVDSDQSVPGFPLFETKIYITQPLYASWTLDWEGWDVSNSALAEIDSITRDYGRLPITHFFNPRIYLPDVLDEEQAAYLTNWISDRVNSKGDEIALHVHMHFDLVAAAGVTPKSEPRWKYRSQEGYDVYMTAYTSEELKQLLSWSIIEFESNGLPRPAGFRAGGWYADAKVLSALAESGFLYDASGRERPLEGPFRNIPWNLNARSMPYYPAIADQNDTNEVNIKILEIPNNGLDTFANRPEVMLARFYANYDNEYLVAPRMVSYMSHPQWHEEEFPRMRKVLEAVSQYSWQRDAGPVIFVTHADIYNVWKQ